VSNKSGKPVEASFVDNEDQITNSEISEDVEMRNMLRSQNRKRKSGGFQSMG